MWGTLFRDNQSHPSFRFIPTHVGNTISGLMPDLRSAVHPHAWGEHISIPALLCKFFGSSPRMWGTLFCVQCWIEDKRFIPTHVGNTFPKSAKPVMQPVHPHACGEHSMDRDSSYPYYGSSPRMWGTQPVLFCNEFLKRFIPTHVGNTWMSRSIAVALAVHPHACGEHPSLKYFDIGHTGSSPRMWGTHSDYRIDIGSLRFIPTHVGNTGFYGAIAEAITVHPHACGEHMSKNY